MGAVAILWDSAPEPKPMKLRFGIIVILACAVGLAFVFQGGKADPPSGGDNTQTQWLCKACEHPFLLTARQVAQRADSDPRRWAPLDCPQCGKKQAYLALVCPKCQTVYFGRDVEGATGRCPHCAPAAGFAATTLEEDRPASGLAARAQDETTKPRPVVKVR